MELSKEEMIEIMAVFKDESAEHLSTLTAKILEIEKNPTNPAAIELLHRTSHSMKGAARMMGLTPIEEIGRALEDRFKAVKDGTAPITPETIKSVTGAIDGIRKLIDKLAATGTVEGFDVSGILTKLEKFN